MTSSVTSLKPYHTFSLPVYADEIVCADTPDSLAASWRHASEQNKPVLIMGEGSNVLFLEDFAGTVIVNRIKGIEIAEDDRGWHLHVGAGENWHHLVEYTLQQGVSGLENLALIPGCVGSAPIQNIGAYGAEFKQFCAYVDVLDLTLNQLTRLSAEQCKFDYRESIFKHEYRQGFAIIAVGLHLTKSWVPLLGYGDLAQLDPATATPDAIFTTVCAMRRKKLPDPALMGNAGSFFKNPVVSAEQAQVILIRYPTAPHYPQHNGTVKFAAGWLIDQCQLKGHRIGGAAVHQQQALVLVNLDGARSDDIVALSRYVRNSVAETFALWLEPEVRFIASTGEVSATEVLS
ncbi:UDP-N-acetylmuramate dehydrogenase [Symbiopectobacterium sp. RP]|uniref:UDP-N-acetylmuramate dehydrogenase n=1 Tax=Symbiopectobacterium sp. RP TaxID=3248553 RepID=UPI003D2731D6